MKRRTLLASSLALPFAAEASNGPIVRSADRALRTWCHRDIGGRLYGEELGKSLDRAW